MDTIVISIDEPSTGQLGYPIHLRHFDPETGEYSDRDSITSTLPADLDDRASWITEILDDEGDQTDSLREIGCSLYNLMNQCDVGRAWFELCRRNSITSRNGFPALRVYLDIKPQKLALLPWEFMTGPDGVGIFYERGHLPMRGVPQVHESYNDRPPILPPIRLLIVKCKMRDDTREEEDLAQNEIDAIIKALGEHAGIWHTYVLHNPTFNQLKELLRREFPANVIHFIAHNPDHAEPAFQLNDEEPLTMRRLEDLIRAMNDSPDLLVFNGCRTIRMIHSEVYQNLGCRAIITNHGLVYGEASTSFSEVFYEQLAASGSIDQAMRDARQILQTDNQSDPYDWGMPTLTVYGEPKKVFSAELDALASRQREIVGNQIDGSVRCVVDRVGTRETIWRAIYGPDNKQKHVILITGKKEYGKSQLLRSALLTCQLRGSLGVMVDLKGAPNIKGRQGSKSARDVLSLICHALIHEAEIPNEARGAIISEESLIGLRLLRDNLAADPQDLAADAYVNSRAAGPLDQEFSQLLRILSQEARAISRTPQGGVLIIALDHIEEINPTGLGLIREGLLRPIARFPGSEKVFLMMADRRTENAIADVHRDLWGSRVEYITVKGFPPHYMPSLWREWAARKGWPAEKRRQWISQTVDYTAFRTRVPPSQLVALSASFEEAQS